MNRRIACVTGASGMIGRRIVNELLSKNIHVRVLCHSKLNHTLGVECFKGSLADVEILKKFLDGAMYLFHCAAELHVEKKMHAVNVEGTKLIYQVAQNSNIKYFCYMSSAGVVGKTSLKWVNESAECYPQNEYERTKYRAEQFTKKKISGCSTIILRPVNVMDEDHPDVFGLALRGSLKDRFYTFLKGKECAHQVHAAYVADIAIFFMDKIFKDPEIFFVGNDEDADNTYQGIWNLYSRLSINRKINPVKYTLPLWVPYSLRKIQGVVANRGDVRYSSKKLSLHGIENTWALTKIAKIIIESIEK